jgi:ATP-dependent helicase/nuclease subunit A
VPPGFSILDDRTGAELRRAATDEVLGLAATRPDTKLGGALTIMIAYAIDDQFDSVLREALSKRDWLLTMARLESSDFEATYRSLAGLDVDDDDASISAAMAGVLSDRDLESIRDVFRTGGAKETKAADLLQAVLQAKSDGARSERLAAAFLTKDGSRTANTATKATRETYPHIADLFEAAKDRFVELRQRRRGLDLISATRALITIAHAVRQRYDHAKAQRAALDFDDLIRKAVSLVQPGGSDVGGAEWVLFKLDGGIDHILVDEAQDTSPAQWSLIDAPSEMKSNRSMAFRVRRPRCSRRWDRFLRSARRRQVAAGGAYR